MKIAEHKARTLGEAIQAAQSIRNSWNPGRTAPEEVWFRGQPKRSYRLIPGVYREQSVKYKYDEFGLVSSFSALASPYLPSVPTDSWDWYFLAQHYRLPTRLLDWTESLVTAMYFALLDAASRFDRPHLDRTVIQPRRPELFDEDCPTVWLLDAGSLNLWATGIDAPYPTPHDHTSPYLWDSLHLHKGSKVAPPVALIPPRRNPRIVAQQGTFTLHGTDPKPIDELADEEDPSQQLKLACIVLDRANIEFLWDELAIAGVTRYSIYQDLDSVAEHLKWVYQAQ